MERCVRYTAYRQELRAKKISFKPVLYLLLVSFVLSVLLFSSNGAVYATQFPANTDQLIAIMYGKTLYERYTGVPKVVTIKEKGIEEKVLTSGITIQDVLKEKSKVLEENDYTEPHIETPITDDMSIEIVKVKYETYTKLEIVEFKTLTQETEDLVIGKSSVKTHGKNGTKEVTYKKVIENGEVKEEIPIQEKIVVNPVNEVILIGTRPKTIQDCGYWDKVIDKYVPKSQKVKNTWMKYIMRKETWCDSGQITKTSKVTYYGLYQFTQRMFRSKGGVDIFDGEEQIKIVSGMYDWGEDYRQQQWGVSNTKFHRETGL